MKKYLAMILSIFLSSPSFANVIYLDFEGIESYPHSSGVNIAEYYNGGAASNGRIGPNLGVSFGQDTFLLCLNTPGVDCSAVSRGGFGPPASQRNAFFFMFQDVINIPAGFDTGLAFAYANPFWDGASLTLYDGVNRTGNLLATFALPLTPDDQCDPLISGGARFCPFVIQSFAFRGIARSIFANLDNLVFDDLTLGSTQIGGGVPEPASWAMMIAGFGFVGAAARRRRGKREVAVSRDI